jgi:phage baseplate assembly protein gpV
MALLVPDVGEVELISRMLNKNTPANVVLKLYKNNVTPGESDVDATYTECAATGYTSITLTGASWTVTTSTGTTTASYAQQTFTFTAQETSIYGYYVETGSTLLWAERFTDGPYSIPSGGGSVKITPQIQLD